MKFGKVLEKTVGALAGLGFGRRNPRLGKLDLAVLQVALMIAALDGKVQKSEIDAFLELAKKCRGANARSVRTAYEAALRAAGYIAILVQVEEDQKVLAAFTDEVVKAMPGDFLQANPEDVRRAFVIWTAMAMSDGEYSDIERRAVEMLEKRFTVIKAEIVRERMDRDAMLSPAFRTAYRGPDGRRNTVRLLPDGFLARIEKELSGKKTVDIAALLKG